MHIDFIEKIHKIAKRNYIEERVIGQDKAACATIAKRFDKNYWDGDRKYGYGGYVYDGRWRVVAKDIAQYYGIKADDRILDVGCGKGFLLYEFTQVIPGIKVIGLDVSHYGINNAKEEVKPYLQHGNTIKLPFEDNSFDLVLSINVLHNLMNYDLNKALREIERVSKKHKYIVNDSYRTEKEKVNLMYWQLTCEVFYTPQEWEWFYQQSGYNGDYSFIFYE